MELVHNDKIIVIRIQLLIELLRIHRLHADEQMIQIFRNIIPDKQFTEIQVTQYTLESIPALGQDFFAMSYKKESASLSQVLFPEVSVIKCSNYRLTGTSMSQVVDRFVFDKIQSIPNKRDAIARMNYFTLTFKLLTILE